MKLSVNREAMAEACQAASAALPPRPLREVLNFFRLDADQDRLLLTAFDTELGIRQELRGVEVVRAGSVLVPALQLTQILRESRGESVELETVGTETTTLRCGAARFELPQRPVDEFPELPDGQDDQGVIVEGPAGTVRHLIRRTLFAADKKDTSSRYALKGILWEPVAGGRCRLVATDAKRLALAEAAVSVQGQEGVTVAPLVPLRAMTLLERSLTDDGEMIRACLGTNDVRFLTERATIYTTLVQGRFPPYRDILERTEKAAKIKIHLPLEDFLASVRQVRIMTDEQSKRVDIAFRPGTAVLESRGAATGAGQVELSLPDFTGPAIRVAFDPDFLVDYLNVVRGEEPASSTRGRASAQPPQNPTTDTAATQTGQVVLELVAPDKPALFRYGDDWVYVVMPMVQS